MKRSPVRCRPSWRSRPATSPIRPITLTFDIDKNNPSFDPARFLLHIGDLFGPNKTNHFEIRKTLVGGDSADFVYYKLV